jgi:hypothetical protein
MHNRLAWLRQHGNELLDAIASNTNEWHAGAQSTVSAPASSSSTPYPHGWLATSSQPGYETGSKLEFGLEVIPEAGSRLAGIPEAGSRFVQAPSPALLVVPPQALLQQPSAGGRHAFMPAPVPRPRDDDDDLDNFDFDACVDFPVEAVDAAAAAPIGDFPSVGSAGHAAGTCQPCMFLHADGCRQDTNCNFCHLCPAGEQKRRRWKKLHDQKKRRRQQLHLKRLEEGTNGDDAEGQDDGDQANELDPVYFTVDHEE